MNAALSNASAHIGTPNTNTNSTPLMEDECIVTFDQHGDKYTIRLTEFNNQRQEEVTKNAWIFRKRVLQRLWQTGQAQAQIGHGTSYKLNTRLMYETINAELAKTR